MSNAENTTESSVLLEQLEALNARLDRVDAHLEQISRRQRALDDLLAEMGPIGKEIYNTALEELSQVEEDFQLEDLVGLGRKVLRNARRLSDMLDTAASMHDFLVDATPLGKDVFHAVVERLDRLERLGAFEYAAEFVKLSERLMETFTPRDLEELGLALPQILETIRAQTQPDVLGVLNEVLGVVREEPATPMGLWDLLKSLKEPAVRQALGMAMSVFKRFPVALEKARRPRRLADRSGGR